MSDKPWYLYMLMCGDGTVYTGISPDPELRLKKHRTGKGAKYTSTRLPLVLIHVELVGTRSEASKLEHATKKLSHMQKLRKANKT